MQPILGHRDTARLTLAFLDEHVGMTKAAIGGLVGLDAPRVGDIIDGRDVAITAATTRSIEGLAATQSLLLSGYTPTGAAAWMRHPCSFLAGRSPREVLSSGDPAATALVLRAASARMAA